MTELQTDSKAVIESRLVHDVHRRATSLLADAAGNPTVTITAVVEQRDFVVETLRHHHESEDGQLWPLIAAAAPETSDALAGLTGEHDRLDAALASLADVGTDGDIDRGALTEAAVAVRDLVHSHLANEEPLLFPALREHVSEQAWDAFSREVVASAPTERIYLLIALFDERGTPEEVELILGHLPACDRALVPALREQGRSALARLQ
jgi:hemerythrin-like domain-containing protein